MDSVSKYNQTECGSGDVSGGGIYIEEIGHSISYRIPNTEYNVVVVPKERASRLTYNKIRYLRTVPARIDSLEDFTELTFTRTTAPSDNENYKALDKLDNSGSMVGLFLTKSNRLYVLFSVGHAIQYCLVDEVRD